MLRRLLIRQSLKDKSNVYVFQETRHQGTGKRSCTLSYLQGGTRSKDECWEALMHARNTCIYLLEQRQNKSCTRKQSGSGGNGPSHEGAQW